MVGAAPAPGGSRSVLDPAESFSTPRADLPPDVHRTLGFHGVAGRGKTASIIAENALGA